MPYIIAIGREMLVDLSEQYNFIIDRYKENKVEIPIAAFFGEFLKLPQKKRLSYCSYQSSNQLRSAIGDL